MNRGHRTLAAIVLTDAVGFSARMSIDEELTLNLIQRDQQIMQQLCQQCEGQVLKSTGDGLLMYFVSAVQAVTCAIQVQAELSRTYIGIEPEKVLLHRIGVHLGDVFFSQSDVMGNGVNIAARLQNEARPGGICISQVVYDVVKSRLMLNAAFAGPLKLKNIQEEVPAYHLLAAGEPARSRQLTPAERQPAPAAASVPAPQRKLEPGVRVGGRYRLQRVLGQGGFGRSYLVEDTQRFNELCVLKEFSPANKSTRSLQKALDLFKREAKTLYQLNHPQVPKFLACFTQGQRLFIVQEYIDGVTYSQLLRQRKQQAQHFSEVEVTRWLMQMLQVLDHLHTLKIVHRDISPDNIMYSRDRNLPVLIDFGLVNDTVSSLLSRGDADDDDSDDDSNHHNNGDSGTENRQAEGVNTPDRGADSGRPKARPATMVGKFGYSPPEQMHLGQCYPCSDLYALGITALVLLTGKYPRDLMDQDSLEVRWQPHITLSPALTTVLTRLTRQRPKERYQSAWEVMQALAELAAYASPLPQPRQQRLPTAQPFSPMPDGIDALPPDHSLTRLPENPHSLTLVDPFVEQCRQALTRCIGPMANVVVEDALDQRPDATPQQLVELLASQLSDGKQAHAFVSQIRLPENSGELGPDSLLLQSDSGRFSAVPGNSTEDFGSKSSEPALTPEFLQRCRQALTRCIGPMAQFIIEETLADYPHLDAQSLVFRLAAEIPDARKATEFQQQLQR